MHANRTRLGISFVAVLVVSVAAVFAATVSVAGATASAVPTITLPTSKPMSAEDAAAVEAQVSVMMSIGGADVPGVLVGVWDPVKGYFKGGFGVADTTSQEKPVPVDAFRIGSLTKTFTATVVLELVAEGKLRLDGRVATYVPRLVKRHPELGTRTIRQLLSMRAGLPEYTDAMIPAAIPRGWTTKVWTPNQLIDFAFKTGPVKPPGAAPAVYSNTNFITLGEIAQAVTHQTLPQLMRTRLLQPLGLAKTVYPRITDTSMPTPSTHGYVGPGGTAEAGVAAGTDVTGWSASWAGAAGIVMSTIDDIGRWAAARFGSVLLPAKLRAERAAVAVPLNAGGTYGLGLQRFGVWEGHFGGIPGWTTMAFRNTQTGAIVVASVNACCGSQSGLMAAFLINGLYPGTFPLQ